MRKLLTWSILRALIISDFTQGQLKTLGTQMGYPIGVPIWVLRKNKSIKIIDNVVMVKPINNRNCEKSLGLRVKNIVKNE